MKLFGVQSNFTPVKHRYVHVASLIITKRSTAKKCVNDNLTMLENETQIISQINVLQQCHIKRTREPGNVSMIR